MRVLHLASFDRWTGAAAPAFVEAEASRQAGIETSYAFVGGYLLEKKLAGVPWAYPVLRPGHGPVATWRSCRAVRSLICRLNIEIVHTHLSHDHWLARCAIAGTGARLVRTFHSERALRRDPLTRWLMRRTLGIAVINPALSAHPAVAGRAPVVTPPPVEPRFVPEGEDARARYGIERDHVVVGFIGKISPGRGGEDAIETFSIVKQQLAETRMLIVGHGPHREALQELIRRLRLVDHVIWAGYHEQDLPAHFRAMDLMLFTASGSDEGHRAISEANASGTPVVAYPIRGVGSVIGELSDRLVSTRPSPDSLASAAREAFSIPRAELRDRVVRNARRFDYESSVRRLLPLYESVLRP